MLTNIKNIDNISIEKFNSFIIKVLANFNKVKNERIFVSHCFNLNKEFSFDLMNFPVNENYLYFEKPDSNFKLFGFDKIYTIEINGENNLSKVEAKISEIEKILIKDSNANNSINPPLVLGGMKFSSENKNELWQDFFDSDWFIPKFLIFSEKGNFYLIYNFFIDENSKPDNILKDLEEFFFEINSLSHSTFSGTKIISFKGNSENEKSKWKESINKILNEIDSGKIKKAVLSRFVEAELSGIPDIFFLLEKLKIKYPDCYLFAYKKNNSIFFGASPEKLLRFNQDFIEADALAGSSPRGKNDIEDKIFENELLRSEKNLREHNSVINYISELFKNSSTGIQFEKNPKIKKLLNIQHLWTPIKIKLNSEENIFSVLGKVHPTPAVCGVPLKESLNLITNIEDYPRGFYLPAAEL